MKFMKTCRKSLRMILLALLLIAGTVLYSGGESRAEESPEKIRTIDSRAILTGQKDPGTMIDIMVYNYPGGRSRATLYHTRFTVGESGIYQVTIPLPVMGEQYVQISIENVLTTLIYERYPAELGDELRGYYLNIYEYLNENRR